MRRNSRLELPETRRNLLDRRAGSQRLVDLAEILPRRDRLLIRAIYRDGQTIRQLATLMDACPRRLARQVARILRRMRSPQYRLILGRGEALPRDVRQVGQCLHVDGKSLRETARVTGQSLHRVRLHAHTIDSLSRLLK